MYTPPPLPGNEEEIDKLHAQNAELKKELEKEQRLHSMLFNEWKALSEKAEAREQQIYESDKPKNVFYKYAFYVLVVALIPVAYFLYPHFITSANVSSSQKLVTESQPVKDTPVAKDTPHAVAQLPLIDTEQKKAAMPAVQPDISVKKDAIQQTAVVTAPVTAPEIKPVIKPAEKKVMPPDSARQTRPTAHKPIVEAPLTDDERDSISSLGFSAYFDHTRNPYRKSSELYKVWEQGRNEGKTEAKKVLEKDSSMRH